MLEEKEQVNQMTQTIMDARKRLRRTVEEYIKLEAELRTLGACP